ncbi:MAG: hypothetical protein OJF59_000115 [Cytophagales bacterium]|nr:MAG: hypothetical protein OJF59_000115 [Cytophagales bacterium]
MPCFFYFLIDFITSYAHQTHQLLLFYKNDVRHMLQMMPTCQSEGYFTFLY